MRTLTGNWETQEEKEEKEILDFFIARFNRLPPSVYSFLDIIRGMSGTSHFHVFDDSNTVIFLYSPPTPIFRGRVVRIRAEYTAAYGLEATINRGES